jgi:hypothetical protein
MGERQVGDLKEGASMPTKITDTKRANLSPEQPTGRNREEKPLMNN